MSKYTAVIPAYNEQEVIELCYGRMTEVMQGLGEYELIFVNDGSADDTLTILKRIAQDDRHVKVISFTRNFGHQEAVSAGLAAATGDAIVIIDADLQDPPEIIPDMIKLWEQGADIVYGKRAAREGESGMKKLTASAFYRTLHLLGAQRIPRDTGDFRVIDRKVAEFLNSLPESHRFLRGMSAWSGFTQVPFEYVRHARAAGATKYTLKKMTKLAGDGITSFSDRPLKIPVAVGCVVSLLSFVMLIVCIVLACLDILSVYYTLFAAAFLLIGLLFISVGVVGIYLGRIYDEAKGRPLYVIREKINF